MRRDVWVDVIDDDAGVLRSLEWMLRTVGFDVRCFASASVYLASEERAEAACLITDVRMPGVSGVELVEAVCPEPMAPATIVVTGHADVPMAVRALKAGAFEFIEKPYNEEGLLDAVRRAIAETNRRRDGVARSREACARHDRLSPREAQVFELVVSGMSNREVATHLGISDKTVEVHRSRVMRKMDAEHLPELVRLAVDLGLGHGQSAAA